MWNERYSEPDFAYGTEPNDFLVEQAGLLPPGAVLELCAGQGRNGVWLAQRGFAVTCVDASSVGLARAAALAVERGVALHTVVADLADYEIAPGAWNGIISIFGHLPPPLRTRVHAACVAGLAPGGVLILEAYTPAQVARGTGGPRDPALCMTLESLRRDFAALELLVAVERERYVHEGVHHHGPSSVVQLVARKVR